MALVLNGDGTVTGLAVGGLPDGTVDAGTVAADVATQAELDAAGVGGATGVDFNDNVKARFGTNNDLSIYHDHANSQNVQLSTSIPITFAANDLKFANGLNDTLLMKIDNDGHITAPKQPAFQAKPTSDQNNIAQGADVTVIYGTEVFDQNSNFNSNVFTAPVTGMYQLNSYIRLNNVDIDPAYYQSKIITSNRAYITTYDTGGFSGDPAYFTFSHSVLADMDAGDTAYVAIHQHANGTAQTDVDPETTFSGYLVA